MCVPGGCWGTKKVPEKGCGVPGIMAAMGGGPGGGGPPLLLPLDLVPPGLNTSTYFDLAPIGPLRFLYR